MDMISMTIAVLIFHIIRNIYLQNNHLMTILQPTLKDCSMWIMILDLDQNQVILRTFLPFQILFVHLIQCFTWSLRIKLSRSLLPSISFSLKVVLEFHWPFWKSFLLIEKVLDFTKIQPDCLFKEYLGLSNGRYSILNCSMMLKIRVSHEQEYWENRSFYLLVYSRCFCVQ